MNTKLVCFLAACTAALLFPGSAVEASLLDDLLGYVPGYTQTFAYNVPNPAPLQYNAVPQYNPAPQVNASPQYGAASYTAGPVPHRQAMTPQQPIAQMPGYRQTVAQNQDGPQSRTPVNAVSKKKGGQSPVAASPPRPTKQRTQKPVARPYQQNRTVQYGPVVQAGYNSAPQGNYYRNPYQGQYNTYYQGYYNSWGSSGQVCPPGRS